MRIRPPSLPRLRSPVACSTEPVPRNSRLLKNAWLSTWYERRGQRQRGHRRHAIAEEQQRQADADDQQADVLDRRVGQQPLHVGLHRGEHHAEQGGGEAERQQHARPTTRAASRSRSKLHAQQAVDRGLEHHAAHQRRHRRRRRRVRLGQPDVQRQRCPALAPKPNSASRKATEAQNGDSCCARMLAKRVVAGVRLQHAEAQQDADRADMRDQQVQVAGAADLGDRGGWR